MAFRAALVAVLTALLAIASAAHAQQGPAWRLASEAGTLRLYRAALLAEQPDGAQQILVRMDRQLGFPGRDGPRRYALPPIITLTPELGYDRNFNGGLASDIIRIGGATWHITPETRAQPSYYAGARLGGTQRVIWLPGAALSLSGSVTYRRALENGLDYRSMSLSGCSENQIDSRTGFDLCLGRALTYRDHSTTQVTTANASLSRLFVQDNSLSEFTMAVGREFYPGFHRDLASLNMRHLDRAHGVFALRLQVGERVSGRSLTTFSSDLEHGRFIGDAYYSLTLFLSHETGGWLLGQRHHRREQGITIILPRMFGIVPSLGYRRSRHDISDFDASFGTFSIMMPTHRF